MKLSSLFLSVLLATSLFAGESSFEKYIELRNGSSIAKTEADRNLNLQNRNENQEIRNYKDAIRNFRSQALYAKVESSYTPYR